MWRFEAQHECNFAELVPVSELELNVGEMPLSITHFHGARGLV